MTEFLLLLLLVCSTAYSDADRNFAEQCARAGGSYLNGHCKCPNGPSINPFATHCDAEKPANRHSRSSSRPFGPDAKEDPGEIMSDQFCKFPGNYLCGPKLNSFAAHAQDAQRNFDLMRAQAQDSSAVREFVSARTQGQGRRCSELPLKEYKECVDKENEAISAQLYTPDRKAKAQALFDRAKKAMLAYLRKQQKELPVFGLQGTEDKLSKMIAEIEGAELVLGSRKGAQIQFNAFASADPRSKVKNNVFLEGLLLQIDAAPETVFRILLHELAHFVNPGKFKSDPNNPFYKEIECLRRLDSAIAMKADPECFERAAKLLENSDQEEAVRLKAIAELLRQNPDTSYAFTTPAARECQMGQMGEAFSDWLSTDVYMDEMDPTVSVRPDSGPAKINPSKSAAFQKLAEWVSGFCPAYNREKKFAPPLTGTPDSHPLDELRMNAIMLAHPLIKFALGCAADESLVAHSGTQSKSPDYRMYCGRNLYDPVRVR